MDNGFMLVLSCIFFGDLAFEATTGASSELAGTFGLAMLSGGHGRPPATPGHVHEFLQSPLMTYLILQMTLHVLYEGCLTYFWNGSTPGKRLLGLAVTRADASPLTLTACLVRAVLKASFWITIPLLWVPLWLHSGGGQQCTIHEAFSGTTVVKRQAAAPGR